MGLYKPNLVSPQNFGCIPAAQVSETSGCIQYAAGAKGEQRIYNSAPTNPDIISKETQSIKQQLYGVKISASKLKYRGLETELTSWGFDRNREVPTSQSAVALSRRRSCSTDPRVVNPGDGSTTCTRNASDHSA